MLINPCPNKLRRWFKCATKRFILLKRLYIFLFVDDLLGSSASAAPANPEPLKKRLMRDLARLTLFAYVLLVFNPVMPIVADKIAHTFYERSHLLTVHQVNGKYHVHLAMANAENQADKTKSSRGGKQGAEEYFHLISVTSYNFAHHHIINRSYPMQNFYLPVSYPDIDYQPPKV